MAREYDDCEQGFLCDTRCVSSQKPTENSILILIHLQRQTYLLLQTPKMMEYWARWMRKRLQPNRTFLSIFQKFLTENVDRFVRKRFFIDSAQSLSFLIACYRSQSEP